MSILNVFASDAFSSVETSAAIQAVPNSWGILQQRNAFPDRGVRTRTVAIERKNGVLSLLPTRPIGAPATQGTSQKRTLRDLRVPHIPYEDTIYAEDVQGLRAFGTDDQFANLADLLNERQTQAAQNHFITREHLRWGALRGIVLDSDGSTLYNLFTEFGVSQPTHDIALSSASTDVAARVRALKTAIETAARGQGYGSIRVYCASDLFDAFVGHAKVEKFFTSFNNSGITLDKDYRGGFPFQGVIFEQVTASWTDAAGNVRKAIPDSTAQVFLETAPGLYATLNAPADFAETVNTPGMPIYSSLHLLKHNRGVELHTQSNPLPVCFRPEMLFKITMS